MKILEKIKAWFNKDSGRDVSEPMSAKSKSEAPQSVDKKPVNNEAPTQTKTEDKSQARSTGVEVSQEKAKETAPASPKAPEVKAEKFAAAEMSVEKPAVKTDKKDVSKPSKDAGTKEQSTSEQKVAKKAPAKEGKDKPGKGKAAEKKSKGHGDSPLGKALNFAEDKLSSKKSKMSKAEYDLFRSKIDALAKNIGKDEEQALVSASQLIGGIIRA